MAKLYPPHMLPRRLDTNILSGLGQPGFIVRTEPSASKLANKATAARYVRAISPTQYLVLLPSGNTRLIRAIEFTRAYPAPA